MDYRNKKLVFELCNINKFITINDLPIISNPIFFKRDNIPTDDGLLSNEIFGTSKYDRSNRFAYISLHEHFIHPYLYKVWCKLDNKVKDCVYGNKTFIIDAHGYLEESDNGENGMEFLYKNIQKIHFKPSNSDQRALNIKVIEQNKNLLFIDKWPIIPAFYRDVNSSDKLTGVGEINQLYNSVLISVRSIAETADYGLNLADAVRGRVQDTLVQIYNWFTDAPNLAKKQGIIRRAGMAKTTDYASRLVISSPDIDAERREEMYVNLDYSAIPLASLCSNLYPYMIFYIRRFFENELSTGRYPYKTKKGEIDYVTVDPQIAFSDKVIKHELDRFMKGYSNRFVPVKIPNEEGIDITMRFKGRFKQVGEDSTELTNRDLTWCDILFRAAAEAAKGKHALLTRYPMNDYMGQFPTKIRVLSTNDTEDMWIGNEHYPRYPKIRQSDIGVNTSNRFIDSLQISNLYLKAIGGDYDGDQLTCKVAYSEDSNKELAEFMEKPAHYISLSGNNIRATTNEAIQAIYNLTRVYKPDMLVNPVF